MDKGHCAVNRSPAPGEGYYLWSATLSFLLQKGPKGFQVATQIQGHRNCIRSRSTWVPVTEGLFSWGWSVSDTTGAVESVH